MSKPNIVLLVWNQLEYTRRCINSIFANTITPCRLVIVDNNSEQETKNYLNSVKGNDRVEVTLITNSKNLGFAKGMNTGMRCSDDSEWVCLLNNDTVVGYGWLDELLTVGQKDTKIGILNPGSNMFCRDKIGYEQVPEHSKKLRTANKGKYVECGNAIGFCMLIKREVINAVGYLDESISPFFYEDTDYCRRAIKAGFICVIAEGAFVYHREHSSVKTLENKEDIYAKSRNAFIKKWGRHLRIAICCDKKDSLQEILKTAIEWARDNNFVHLFFNVKYAGTKNIFEKYNLIRHVDVSAYAYEGICIKCYFIFRVLKRIKKRYDAIFVIDKNIANIFKKLKFIHKAKVFTSMDGEEFKELWKKKFLYQ